MKLPIKLMTLRNSVGRSQATVKAQIAPLLAPPIALPAGFFREVVGFTNFREHLFNDKAGIPVSQRIILSATVVWISGSERLPSRTASNLNSRVNCRFGSAMNTSMPEYSIGHDLGVHQTGSGPDEEPGNLGNHV